MSEPLGVRSALGYEFRRPNRFQRTTQRFASSTLGARIFSRVTQPLDRLGDRLTKGRTSVSEVLAGLPVVTVTTTGRKSGEPRPAPLIALPIDGDLALIGTNFGGVSTPAWVYNLEADPAARVTYRDRTLDVVARSASDEERERIFADSAQYYSGYQKYRERVTDREIRVFVLSEA